MPAAAARPRSSSARRDLPMPASPVTSSAQPWPRAAASTSPNAVASSARRPTSTGLREVGTDTAWRAPPPLAKHRSADADRLPLRLDDAHDALVVPRVRRTDVLRGDPVD